MENKKFKPTTEWMRAHYDEFNQELFNGELGDCILRPFTSGKGSQGKTLGWFKLTASNLRYERLSRRLYQRNINGTIFVSRGNFVEVAKPCIELNANYSWTEEAMCATLVHEMCHYYNFMYGLVPKQGHGREFKAIGAIVSNRSNGRFTIQRLASAEQMSQMDLDQDIKEKNDLRDKNKRAKAKVVGVYRKTGSIELSIVGNDNIVDEIVRYCLSHPQNRGGLKKIIMYQSAEPVNICFNKGYCKVGRTYRYWTLNDTEWFKELEKYPHKVLFGKEEEQPKPKAPSRKKMFRLLNSRGETAFEMDATDEAALTDAIKKQYPNLSPEAIQKLIANPRNYYTMNEGKRTLEKIITEAINKFLKKEMAEDKIYTITPDMNLGVMMPDEMEN